MEDERKDSNYFSIEIELYSEIAYRQKLNKQLLSIDLDH